MRSRVLRKVGSLRPYLLRLHRDRPGRPRLQDLSEREGPRELILDTSVAVKFHVPEEQHEEACALRTAFEEGRVELLAPGTILPEAFHAFWQLHRRDELSREEIREG